MFALDISGIGVILNEQWGAEALEWSRLTREILEAVLKEEGGYTAYTSLVLALLLVAAVIGGVALAVTKQREIDRMAREKERLETQVLANRKSTGPNDGGLSPRGGEK